MDSKHQPNLTPHNIFYALMQQVGLHGNYQTALIIFCSLLCFQGGMLSLGTPYYFAIPRYTNCPSPHQSPSNCNTYVCSLPFQQRFQYLHAKIGQLRTLGNAFGDYHCQNSDSVQMAKGMPFFGAILGFFVTGILADNVGRRITLIVCLSAGIVGYVIIIFASNLTAASIGLFVCGFGIETCFNLGLYLVSEVLQNKRRQQIAVLIQAVFCLAGLFTVFIFYALKDWKLIFIFFCLIPLILCLLFNIFILKETPQFLVKSYPVEQIRASLRFIAKMNKKLQNFDENDQLSEQYINKIKTQYLQQINKDDKTALTYLDLFRYPSLRNTSIFVSLIFGCTAFLYYAPLMLVDSFGFDFYINGVLVNISELLTYFLSYFAISKIPRKRISQILFGLSAVFCFILIFLHRKQICEDDCVNFRVVVQLILVFAMRFCVSFQYQILFIYATELFPVQIIAVALGFNCIFASIPSIFINQVINVANRMNFPVMVLFCMVSVLDACLFVPLKQTDGRQPVEKINQLQLGVVEKVEQLIQQAT